MDPGLYWLTDEKTDGHNEKGNNNHDSAQVVSGTTGQKLLDYF